MCDKEPYPTEADARAAVKGIGRQYGQTMKYYYCDACGCWHLKTTGKKPKWKRNNNNYPFRYQPVKKKTNKKKK